MQSSQGFLLPPMHSPSWFFCDSCFCEIPVNTDVSDFASGSSGLVFCACGHTFCRMKCCPFPAGQCHMECPVCLTSVVADSIPDVRRSPQHLVGLFHYSRDSFEYLLNLRRMDMRSKARKNAENQPLRHGFAHLPSAPSANQSDSYLLLSPKPDPDGMAAPPIQHYAGNFFDQHSRPEPTNFQLQRQNFSRIRSDEFDTHGSFAPPRPLLHPYQVAKTKDELAALDSHEDGYEPRFISARIYGQGGQSGPYKHGVATPLATPYSEEDPHVHQMDQPGNILPSDDDSDFEKPETAVKSPTTTAARQKTPRQKPEKNSRRTNAKRKDYGPSQFSLPSKMQKTSAKATVPVPAAPRGHVTALVQKNLPKGALSKSAAQKPSAPTMSATAPALKDLGAMGRKAGSPAPNLTPTGSRRSAPADSPIMNSVNEPAPPSGDIVTEQRFPAVSNGQAKRNSTSTYAGPSEVFRASDAVDTSFNHMSGKISSGNKSSSVFAPAQPSGHTDSMPAHTDASRNESRPMFGFDDAMKLYDRMESNGHTSGPENGDGNLVEIFEE